MQVFELHFNSKNKEDKIFDSFVYEPETVSEKRLGNLYIAGEFTKVLPQNFRFLDNLASVIKKEYYAASFQKSCEESLRGALKKANEFLDKEARKGNVNWLGNLHFAILNFKDFVLNFTKVGGMKILLSRDGELLDIGHNLEFQEADPYPLKVFGSVAIGKLAPNDKIILLTKDLFSVLTEKGDFLNQLKDISNEKELKKILKANKPALTEASGICLFMLIGEEAQAMERVILNKKTPYFSLKWPKLPSLGFKFPKVKFSFGLPNKNKLLILTLLLILIVGFFVFNSESEKNPIQAESEKKLELARSKVSMAENFFIFKEEERAKNLLREAQNILASLIEQNSPLKKEAVSLQKTVEGYLYPVK
jgi:hypothetical protein